ncbi:HAD-IA family hydrolase [Streptomyces sp. LARHCF249]
MLLLSAEPDIRLSCDALLFDMDGVLVDSLPTIERHLRDWSLEHGLDPAKVLALSGGRTTLELIELVAPGLDASAEEARLLVREVEDTAGISASPGASSILADAGPWAVVTSGRRAVARARLTAAGLPIPDVLVTADDVTTGKPDPQGYLQAARRLGVAAGRCVVLEDAAAGLDAGAAAGMTTIEIRPLPTVRPRLGDHLVTGLDALRVVR